MEPQPVQQARTNSERLPTELAAGLTPRVRDALGHPLRRQILRALNGSAAPRSLHEIATTTLPGAGVSVISYHAQVLTACGSVAPSGSGDDGLYASTVAGDEQIVSVLQATRETDRPSENQ